MKEKIETKIAEIVDFIVSKPVEGVTLDDYTILNNELKDIRFRESQAGQNKRMAELLALAADNTYIGGMFTDEFDKLFDVDDYTLDTYVEVIYITGSSKEIEHIEFEIYAFYDSSKKEIRNFS